VALFLSSKGGKKKSFERSRLSGLMKLLFMRPLSLALVWIAPNLSARNLFRNLLALA
jgi:hypothetical protein